MMAYSKVSADSQSGFSPIAINSTIASSASPKVASLAALWAKNYVASVSVRPAEEVRVSANLPVITSKEGRVLTAEKLKSNLTSASAQAWSMTEALLSDEVRRHGIDPRAINPWQIAADSHDLFQKALVAYADRVTPHRLSVIISNDFGQVRQKYTQIDPRAIGFVSMQFHYTGQVLLEGLSIGERLLLEPYFKVMDDHLYMPLKAAYSAAANYEYGAPALRAVRSLLPISTKIAHTVCKQVGRQHPGYQSHSGSLNSPRVRVSSIRDVEMFQVYLCLCVLEDSIQSVQQELFPLCVMLYPRLRVSWRLVQDMLQAIAWEMHDRLLADDAAIFLPYLHTLTEMFSSDVFGA